jgi:cytochrome oxidase Cu insertion factor (SCO1/SenC/PrrC family)
MPPAAPPPPRRYFQFTPFRILWIGMALGGLLVGLVFLILLGQSGRPPEKAAAAPAEPVFVLTNQLGERLSSTSLKGRIQVVSFISPYCREECPLIAHHYVEYADAIRTSGWSKQVILLSFNLDPKSASPATLARFQRIFGWNPKDPLWEFLTGPPPRLDRVVKDGFHVWFGKVATTTRRGVIPALRWHNPLNPHGLHPNPSHEDPLEIYGPGGHLRRIFQSGSLVSTARLLHTLYRLIPHAPAQTTPRRAP